MWFKASSPGSLMLLGEHAVLHRKHALVCAIDKRMHVALTPRADKKILLSSALGEYQVEISKIKIAPPFQFVLATLKYLKKSLPSGCEITIESEFSDKMGFASSAAVTVAVLSALHAWVDLPVTPEDLIKHARRIVRSVQGLGSGADVAACVLGGMVAYRSESFWAEKLPHIHPIAVQYVGYKTPTVEVIHHVKNTFASDPLLLKKICEAIDHCALQGIQAVRNAEWQLLGNAMNIQQGLMEALGVNTPELSALILKLRKEKNILGAKISGSGLGDCVVGLGEISNSLPVAITSRGVEVVSNTLAQLPPL